MRGFFQICVVLALLCLAAFLGADAKGHHPPGTGHHKKGGHKGKNGPCSKKSVTIKVFSAADILRRTKYVPRKTVTLVLQNHITLSAGLVFGHNFSCTILTSARPQGFTITARDFKQPLLKIWQANNVLLYHVNLAMNNGEQSPSCLNMPAFGATSSNKGIICPAIHIWRAYGIQITSGFVQGRIDLYRSAGVLLDSLKVTSVLEFDRSPGAIRVGLVGDGGSATKSSITISNNDISGVETGINLYYQTVGVTVKNNFIHDYTFAAIRCGYGIHFAGDCMLNTMSNNYILTRPSFKQQDPDGGGIYFGSHWINPGNYLSCNYVVGGNHCYYLDWVTSGVTIKGGVCYQNRDGLKINTGKNNDISGLLMVQPKTTMAWISCQNYDVNNCNLDPGSFWEGVRKQNYSTPVLNRLYPWMQTICTKQSTKGQACNPPGAPSARVTGKCSGLPTDNKVSVAVIDPGNNSRPKYLSCEKIPFVAKLNDFTYTEFVNKRLGFLNYAAGDFGVHSKHSPLYKLIPGFVSCPKSRAGIQIVPATSYFSNFNIKQPAGSYRWLLYQD